MLLHPGVFTLTLSLLLKVFLEFLIVEGIFLSGVSGRRQQELFGTDW